MCGSGENRCEDWEQSGVPHGAFSLVRFVERILRHANVSTTASYYIKSAADDVRDAMTKLENQITVTSQTQTDTNGTSAAHTGPPSGSVH